MGYCREQGRYLSDVEKIDIAINYLIATYPPILTSYKQLDGGAGVSRSERPPNPIPYKGIEEFKRINKDCCEMTVVASEGYRAPFFYRIWGSVSGFAHIKYLVRYKDKDGNVIETPYETYPAVSNCGRVWSGI